MAFAKLFTHSEVDQILLYLEKESRTHGHFFNLEFDYLDERHTYEFRFKTVGEARESFHLLTLSEVTEIVNTFIETIDQEQAQQAS